ncbi:MAG: ATP-binding protein [Prevotella sp.]|jgi:predicted AAA+ superfamily ATPase|nr:ATP-binding protein [Prevotella sp.]MCH3992686.1 ATP-binding protein [Prevotella sp.]MCH4019143.1 ATP-binding protein [Prevotella sp.]MCI1323610.1 ATP-binding protein [Prevotella sp.]MCI1349439.1 ATP-binding protein [Prevotella sp.]
MDTRRLLTVFSDQREELQQNDLSSLCSREEEKQLSLNSNLAQIVIGVRRSGKSTICEKYLRQNHVNFAYVNFDDDRLSSLKTEDFDIVLDALYQLYGDFKYLFLDEVQNIADWQLFINRLLRQKIHLFVTGSNSKLLSTELTTHLTGRHTKIELYPFSFREYGTMKKVELNSLSTKAVALRKKALSNYLIEGGFPELLNETNKRGYIETLLNSIIKNDIARRFRIKFVDVLRRLAAYLSDNFCQEFVASDLAKLFDISDHTAENYYSYLKEAYLLLGVPKFSYKSKDRIRNEKVYVVDVAFVSERKGTFSSENMEWRLENVVYIELLRRNRPEYNDVFYYRNSQWEIDFIVAKNGQVNQLIQVSYNINSEKTRKREINGLVRGAEKFKCENLLLINFDEQAEIEKDGHTIQIVPAAEWLTGNL